jgi:hypothetical protein
VVLAVVCNLFVSISKILNWDLFIGVVASQLAQVGKSVLVIEKGAYYHESEFVPEEAKAFIDMYENGGFAPTYDGSVNVLAGSVFGGGTTVNWCASLKVRYY